MWALQDLSVQYAMFRNYDDAIKTIDRALALDPTALEPLEVKSKLAIAGIGDFSFAEKAFESVKSLPLTTEQKIKVAGGRANVFLLERRYNEGLQTAEGLPDDGLAILSGGLCTKYYLIGFARKSLHDDNGARAAFLKAKSAAEQQLKRSPDAADLHIQLAKVLAYLGEKEAALAEAQRATELQPESKDAFGGPEITAGVAEVYAILGDKERAIEILDGLLNRPSSITVQFLK